MDNEKNRSEPEKAAETVSAGSEAPAGNGETVSPELQDSGSLKERFKAAYKKRVEQMKKK